jgi:CRISPR-associated protein Csm5
MKTFRLKFEVLSPLHIGSGTQLDPLNYLIKDGKLHVVSFERLIRTLPPDRRDELEAIIDGDNLPALREFVIEQMNPEADCVYSVQVSSSVEALYREKIQDIQNQLLINPFLRTGIDLRPYVPGSSIKGAIRTAVVSELARERKLPKPRNFSDEIQFEYKLLKCRDAKEDPFRGLLTRDTFLKEDDIAVQMVENVSRKRVDDLGSNSIQIICEVSNAAITGRIVEFETDLSLDDLLFSKSFLSAELTAEQIFRDCNMFYRPKLQDEHKRFYSGTRVDGLSKRLLEMAFEDHSFLLRIGRFSGVESVTLDEYRNPRPPGNKKVWGTTRNIADGKYPMGWVKVSFVDG